MLLILQCILHMFFFLFTTNGTCSLENTVLFALNVLDSQRYIWVCVCVYVGSGEQPNNFMHTHWLGEED